MIRTLPLIALFALTSCTFQPGVPVESIPGADVEACEHLNDGNGLAVEAKADGTLASVDKAHARYDIALSATGDGLFGGKVLYNSAEEADYVFFFDQDVALEVRDVEAHAIKAAEQASSSIACKTVKARYVVPLGKGAYTLHLGPLTAATVSLVIEATAHEDHDHEDHDHDHDH